MSSFAAFLTLAALIAATLSGVVGMAGGALLIGIMVVAGLEPAVAVPVHAAVQLVSNATRAWAHRSHINWRPVVILCVAALPGPILGLWLASRLDVSGVKLLMGLAIIVAAWLPKRGFDRLGEVPSFAMAGALAGILGVVVGAIGPVIAPFFLRSGFDKRSVVGTKAACATYIHVLKLVAFGIVGFEFRSHASLILPMAAACVVGTFVGRWLLTRLSEKSFGLIYRFVLTVLGARLLLAATWG